MNRKKSEPAAVNPEMLRNLSGMVGYADGQLVTAEKIAAIERVVIDGHHQGARADHVLAAAFLAGGIRFQERELARREWLKNIGLATGGLALFGLGREVKASQVQPTELRFEHTRELMATQEGVDWVSRQTVPLGFGFDSRSIGVVVDRCSAGDLDSIQVHAQFIRAGDGIADPANGEMQLWTMGMWTHQAIDPIHNYREGIFPLTSDLVSNVQGGASDPFGLYNCTFQKLPNGYRVPAAQYDAGFRSSQNYLGEGYPRAFKVNMVLPLVFRDRVKTYFQSNPNGRAVLQLAQVSATQEFGLCRLQIVATPPETRVTGVANPLVATDHNSFTGDYRSYAFGGGTDPALIPGTIAIQPGSLRDNLVEARVGLYFDIDRTSDEAVVDLPTDADGDIYRIESSGDLVTWETSLECVGDGHDCTHREPLAGRKFFRARKYSNL